MQKLKIKAKKINSKIFLKDKSAEGACVVKGEGVIPGGEYEGV